MADADERKGKEMLNIKDVAALLHRSERAVATLKARDPSFPLAVQWGKRHMWSRADIEAWRDYKLAPVAAENAERRKRMKGGAA